MLNKNTSHVKNQQRYKPNVNVKDTPKTYNRGQNANKLTNKAIFTTSIIKLTH